MRIFDTILAKACKVAGARKMDKTYVIGEEGWFEILEFLQAYRNDVSHLIYKIKPEELVRNFRNVTA